MSANLRFLNGSSPTPPPDGYTSIYVDGVDRNLKQIDALGGITDLTKGSGLIANNEKIINSVSDLPTLTVGKYILEANTTYKLGADIVVANTFDVSAGGIFWTSFNPNGATLNYFGVDPLFAGTDHGTFVISDATIISPNATAANLSDLAAPNSSVFNIQNSVFVCKNGPILNNLLGFSADNSSVICEKGMTFSGSGWTIISLSRIFFVSSSPTFIGLDFGACTSFDINIGRLFFQGGAGGFGISGLPSSGNILPTGAGSIRDTQFIGVTPFTGGFDPTNDVRWNVRDNSQNVQSTRPGALIFLRSNTVETQNSLVAIGVPVKAAGVFVQQLASRFITDSTGRITSLSERPTTVNIETDIIFEPASGNARILAAYIAINGVVELNSVIELVVSANDPKLVTIHWESTLNLNDYIEIFFANKTVQTNILGSSITLRVSE